MTDPTQNSAALYADAIRVEKAAWQELQAQALGSPDRAEAWGKWAEAISRTNRAWRQLSCETISQPRHGTNAAADVRQFHRQSSTPYHGH